MFGNKFFRVTLGVFLLLLIIFISFQIPGFSEVISNVVELVLIPVLMATFIYYLLRPVVRFLEKYIKSRDLAIVITLLGAILFAAFIVYFGGNIIYTEIRRLINFLSDYETIGQGISGAFAQIEEFGINLEIDLEERVSSFIEEAIRVIRNYDYIGIFASITQTAVILLLVPFLVVYFLKDDNFLAQKAINIAPSSYQPKMEKILETVDLIFSIYIPSQLLVGMISGGIIFIGYIIIGMPNPIGLAVILAVASIIPFIGPALGILPALFIAITTSLSLFLKVGILMAIVQLFENNVIRPILQGGKLHIHPVIVIFVILIATMLFGILGALFALPVYASVIEVNAILKGEK